jgi:hypothetical protein
MEQQRSLAEIREESHPHACYGGYVFIGIVTINEETGEEEEVVTKSRCRRCGAGEGSAA